MAKESKLKNILLECSAGLVGSAAGGILANLVYTPGTLDISKEKYTTLGLLVRGIIGAYTYYSSKE